MTDVVQTSVEVDADLWRQMKAEAIREGRTVHEQLEIVLRDRYELAEGDDDD